MSVYGSQTFGPFRCKKVHEGFVRLVHKVIIWLTHAVIELKLLGMGDFAVKLKSTEVGASFGLCFW